EPCATYHFSPSTADSIFRAAAAFPCQTSKTHGLCIFDIKFSRSLLFIARYSVF
ncbi:hypothetical protein L9F63_017324, partial [Diploptera punctata]